MESWGIVVSWVCRYCYGRKVVRTYQRDPEVGVSVHLNCWAFSLVESSSSNILPALCFRGEGIILAGMPQDWGDAGSVSSFTQITFVTWGKVFQLVYAHYLSSKMGKMENCCLQDIENIYLFICVNSVLSKGPYVLWHIQVSWHLL